MCWIIGEISVNLVNIRVRAKIVLEPINCKYLDSVPGSFESPRSLRLSASNIESYVSKVNQTKMGC